MLSGMEMFQSSDLIQGEPRLPSHGLSWPPASPFLFAKGKSDTP